MTPTKLHRRILHAGAWLLASALMPALPAFAQTTRPAASAPVATPARQAPAAAPNAPTFPVVVSGVVPDEATRQSVLSKVREVYGADRVVDQLGVGSLVAPPNWSAHLQRMIGPDLKRVSRGQMTIRGNNIEMRGEVANEASRQEVLSRITTAINNPTYTVRNGLRVSAAGQDQVDAALANRIVEFELASSELTPLGRTTLEGLMPILRQLSNRNFEIIGHTDSQGSRSTNIALSSARADAVKTYLVSRGIKEASITTLGAGPDRPIAANETADGRARNRRIELRVGQ